MYLKSIEKHGALRFNCNTFANFVYLLEFSMPRFIIYVLLACMATHLMAQVPDSLAQSNHVDFKPAALIIPAGLLTYGIVGVKNDPIFTWDRNLRNSFNPDRRVNNIDDFTAVAPVAAVYTLSFAGVETRYAFKQRTVALITASAIVLPTVLLIKGNTTVRRPVGRSKSSFPSGHTALSFMGAEFMNQELKYQSIWYSVAGYTTASFTGFMRLYNDKHWFSDIAAGAAIGILGTKIAYWLQPIIQNAIFKQNKTTTELTQSLFIAPAYTGNELVLAATYNF